MANYGVESHTQTPTQTSLVQNNDCFFMFWHPMLVRPGIRLFCLQAKNGLIITNRNKAVFTVRPVWVTNGRRSAVIALLGLRMLQFRLGMDGPFRSTKQRGLSDFVSHTMQFLVSSSYVTVFSSSII